MLVVALLLVSAVFLWRITSMRRSHTPALGDGRNPQTYGFDLANFTGARDLLVASGLPRDGMPVLDLPPVWDRSVVDSLAGKGRAKYLVSGDRVIGVEIGGRTRAYPLILLNWHEVVNDTLGGAPILVTYNPLCDAAVVYDRRLDGASPALFGHSGLLYNSDALLYDRGSGAGGASLWVQLTGEAVSGPAAGGGWDGAGRNLGDRGEVGSNREGWGENGSNRESRDEDGSNREGWDDGSSSRRGSDDSGSNRGGRDDAGSSHAGPRGALRLRALPCQLVTWQAWKERHPDTTVPARDPARKDWYRREPYTSYFGNDLLRYPVRPLPAGDEIALKTPCVILEEDVAGGAAALPAGTGGFAEPHRLVLTLPEIAARADAQGIWRTAWQGRAVAFRYEPRPPTVWVESDPPVPAIRHAFRFAWHALSAE